MTTPLVIIGCGGSGREIHDIVEALAVAALRAGTTAPYAVIGYLDDTPHAANVTRVEDRGASVLGGTGWLATADSNIEYVIGIGDGSVRRRIDGNLLRSGRVSATLLHPTASCGSNVRLGPGTVVWAGAGFTTNISVGRHGHVNRGSTVGHDTVLGDYVTINPLVAVSGDVTVADDVLLGTHSTVLQGRRIGARSVVGAAACVVKDVPADVVVKGVPAR